MWVLVTEVKMAFKKCVKNPDMLSSPSKSDLKPTEHLNEISDRRYTALPTTIKHKLREAFGRMVFIPSVQFQSLGESVPWCTEVHAGDLCWPNNSTTIYTSICHLSIFNKEPKVLIAKPTEITATEKDK